MCITLKTILVREISRPIRARHQINNHPTTTSHYLLSTIDVHPPDFRFAFQITEFPFPRAAKKSIFKHPRLRLYISHLYHSPFQAKEKKMLFNQKSANPPTRWRCLQTYNKTNHAHFLPYPWGMHIDHPVFMLNECTLYRFNGK